jgi:hypothetical protein
MRKDIQSEGGGVVAALPWDQQSNSSRLATLTGKSLDTIKTILDMPAEPGNLKLLSIKKDAALSILGAQIKVDDQRLRASSVSGVLELLARVREEEARTDQES